MSALNFIPLMLTTLALAFASFTAKKDKNWLVVAFVIWLLTFFWTFYM
ncbi:MAG: hypothetical protein AABX65_04330 [Nanoarchaeota archaeon]